MEPKPWMCADVQPGCRALPRLPIASGWGVDGPDGAATAAEFFQPQSGPRPPSLRPDDILGEVVHRRQRHLSPWRFARGSPGRISSLFCQPELHPRCRSTVAILCVFGGFRCGHRSCRRCIPATAAVRVLEQQLRPLEGLVWARCRRPGTPFSWSSCWAGVAAAPRAAW